MAGLERAVQGMNVQSHALNDGAGNLARQRANGSRADQTLFIDGVRGVTAKTISLIDGQGTLQNTGNATDLAIDGNGYFVVSLGGEIGFKRTGSFYADKNGRLVDFEGNALKAWPTNSDGTIDTSQVTNKFQISQLQDVVVNKVATIADPTKNVSIGANLPATATVGQPEGTQQTPIEIYDSLGNAHTMNLEWTKVDATHWDVKITAQGADNVYLTGTTDDYKLRVTFDGKGYPAQFATVMGGVPTITPLVGSTLPNIEVHWTQTTNAPENSDITLNLGTIGQGNGITAIGDEYSASRPDADGVPFGSFSGVSVSDDGFVVAKFSNGAETILAKIPLANFASVNNLKRESANRLAQTEKSGAPVLFEAKTGGIGSIQAQNLEGSLIDTGTELTNMVLAQNAFTQNAKSFQINAQVLKELTNIV